MLNIISESAETTKEIARKLACLLNAGDVLCVFGNLGAGKTVFASGISNGLGINEHISSPTFTIVHEYAGRLPFYHFDAYRINSDEFIGIGGDEYLYAEGISFIEWPENIIDALPSERLEIYIDYIVSESDDIQQRKILFKPLGEKYEKIVTKLAEELK